MNAEVRKEGATLFIKGDVDKEHVPRLFQEILSFLNDGKTTFFTLDLEDVERIDSSGVALLEEISERVESRSQSLDMRHIPDHVSKALSVFSLQGRSRKRKKKETFLEKTGFTLYKFWLDLEQFFLLFVDITLFSLSSLFSRKGIRKGEFLNQCMLIGMNALPIIGLISFLIGFVLALQSAAQLRQFGASIYVADLIAISMTREMGPIMTAVVLAGRSGSSFTSEIANMVVTEETDALKSMGLNPVRYNVVPKVHAITLTAPLLTVLSMLIGIAGSFVIGISYLGIAVEPFVQQVINALILKDVLTGLLKSLVFAWIVVVVGAHYGFSMKGGSEGVGRATTASVVTSIFLVILADSILGLLFYFGTGLDM